MTLRETALLAAATWDKEAKTLYQLTQTANMLHQWLAKGEAFDEQANTAPEKKPFHHFGGPTSS